ncbi:MAG: UDP-N-acetylmuramate dehydrogenase [Treponema sp.]|nr:UDP-N-acetylmuramate dehydrogenase [Treponema sp.]MCL2251164.1 UDP-N-acetylmuramate dehydrogenase [Treponema sp.]
MSIIKIKEIIDQCLINNPCSIRLFFDEPMRSHTTFKVGGNADCLVRPIGEGFTAFCIELLNNANAEKIPVFILGGGANIVVSDKGIRGIVIDMNGWKDDVCRTEKGKIIFKSGTKIDDAAIIAGNASLCGLEFLSGMPGTIGGAVWMNARCYGSEVADVLGWVEIIVKEKNKYVIKKINVKKKDFDYKISPFQKMDCIIIKAAFKLKDGDKEEIFAEMEEIKEDRQKKGHYDFPCAGSVFKNNKDFGKPVGKIIDELGLKGFQIGEAQVAPFHGNIIINTGNAKAADIRILTEDIAKKVKDAKGFVLEPEIIFVGEW